MLFKWIVPLRGITSSSNRIMSRELFCVANVTKCRETASTKTMNFNFLYVLWTCYRHVSFACLFIHLAVYLFIFIFSCSRRTLLSWSLWVIHLLESSLSCQLCVLCGTSNPRKSMIPREQERKYWTFGVHQRSCWETWTFLTIWKNMTKTIFRWVSVVFIS